jgi:hypothetical protein
MPAVLIIFVLTRQVEQEWESTFSSPENQEECFSLLATNHGRTHAQRLATKATELVCVPNSVVLLHDT